jgi:flagellar protein FliS
MYDELYSAYNNDSILMATPMRLVTALYEGAINAVEQARRCLAAEDIMGRSTYISKAVNILGELIASLDREKGGEIGERLGQLYAYMLQRIMEAHTRQAEEPLAEVSSLLSTLLDGWRSAEAQLAAGAASKPVQMETSAYGSEAAPSYSVCETA